MYAEEILFGEYLFKVENANSVPNATTGQSNATFTSLTDQQFVGSVSDIEIGKDENHIFVTFHNYGVENIFYSNDGGETWQDKMPKVPRYYSPTELLEKRVTRLERDMKNLKKELNL